MRSQHGTWVGRNGRATLALCVLGGIIAEAQDSRLDSDVQIDSMAYAVAMCWGNLLIK